MKVIRVLVYEGSEDWMIKQMKQNGVKGIKDIGGGNTITEYMSGFSYDIFTSQEDLDTGLSLIDGGTNASPNNRNSSKS